MHHVIWSIIFHLLVEENGIRITYDGTPQLQAIAEVLGKTICNSLVEITKNYDKRDEIANCAKILADKLAEKTVVDIKSEI